MTCQQGNLKAHGGAHSQKSTQKLVNQGPVYDRSLKVHRPRKKKGVVGHPKFL